MTVKCCVCDKERINGVWFESSHRNTLEKVSHTYCPVCFAEAMAVIKRDTENQRQLASA